MKIIEKIEIHRFRSISDASIETNEVIVFSGINNSGKSNILKALNLFFSKNSSFGQKYDFDKDYNKAHTGQAGGKREIKITLYFSGQGNAALKKPFFISKIFEMGKEDPGTEYHSTDPKVQKSIGDKDGNITRQFTRFLNRIEFFYVPAVRDKNFVRSLFLHFEKLIEHNSGDDFKKKMDGLSNVLQENSLEIGKDFEKFIGLPTQANLSSKITDILSTVEVNVKTGIKVLRRTKRKTSLKDVYVDLFSSGDGILMSYLAYFLAHVCRKISNKNFIWGFEEPENSLEYSRVQKMAEEFNNEFKKNAQIFITTHSPAFIELKEQKDVNFFRVYIKPDDPRQNSEIKTLNEIRSRQQTLFSMGQVESSEYKKLQEELHFVEFAKEIEAAVERVRVEEKLLLETRREFETKNKTLLAARPEKIFICEDKDDKVIKLWKKLLEMFYITDITVMSSEGSAKNFVEIFIRQQQKLTAAYSPKVFRQIDRDSLTDEQITSIENKVFVNEKRDLNYEFKFLPVNEIENFTVLSDTQKFTEVFWDTNKNEIMDIFQRTAESMLKKAVKVFDNESDSQEIVKFRSDDGGYVAIIQGMRDAANLNWRKFFPGKEMCKKLLNFNPIDYLSILDKNNLPEELVKYMTEVKKFYEN